MHRFMHHGHGGHGQHTPQKPTEGEPK
jgi:hypothetical protein